jgi:PAS domain S-box-containing protein
VENVPAGVYRATADPEGRLLHANAAFAELLGYDSVDELIQVPVRDLHEEPEKRADALSEMQRAGALKGKEVRLRKKDGTPMWASVTATAQRDEQGNIEWIDGVLEDITQRKEAEERMAMQTDRLRRELSERYDMVGESELMRELFRFIRKVAPTEAGVLICGESGTGKEMVARAMHGHSRRAGGPLEVVNCAAVPATLLESELFGHVRGAFTGAVADKPGRFELADGGTLFLDEVAELSLECQAKLLRALEGGMVRRVGDTRDRTVDVRVIAATNRDPDQAVSEGRLRQDLFYRLDRLRVVVPPLRERGDDIELLAEHFLEASSQAVKSTIDGFAPETIQVFKSNDWAGNVRELKNVIERMIILGEGPLLGPEDLPDDIRAAARGAQAGLEPLSEVEKTHILHALRETGGNKSEAARMLGIDRSTLYARLKRYRIGA